MGLFPNAGEAWEGGERDNGCFVQDLRRPERAARGNHGISSRRESNIKEQRPGGFRVGCSGVNFAVCAGLVAFKDQNRISQQGGGVLDVGRGKAFVFAAGDLDFLVLF